MTVEDTELPLAFGSAGKPRLTTVEEGVGKMRAALAARQDKAFTIVGRTSAAQFVGIDEAIGRARAYEAAGVDALFFVGVKTRAELEKIAAATRLPIIMGGAGPELKDKEVLGKLRVRVALQGHQPFMASVQAAHDTLKALREGTPPEKLERVAGAELMKRVTREDDYARWSRDFLGG